MMGVVLLAVACGLLAVGCGATPNPVTASITPAPTAAPVVSPPPVEIPAAPIARLGVSVDNGALVAVQGISAVTMDASRSSGTGLRYGIDFGDGQGSDQATASHVYLTGGRIYKVRVIVTDSLGRIDSITVDVDVKNIEGYWYNSFFNVGRNRYEVRTLRIVTQSGRQLTGLYTHPEGYTSAFTGEVRDERGLAMTLSDGTITFRSQSANAISSDARTFSVAVKGGSADGLTLAFSK